MAEERNYKIVTMIPKEKVAQRIEELGKQISADYAGRTIHMICVLKGGVYFMTALSNAISGARERYIAAGFHEYLTKPVDFGKHRNHWAERVYIHRLKGSRL